MVFAMASAVNSDVLQPSGTSHKTEALLTSDTQLKRDAMRRGMIGPRNKTRQFNSLTLVE
jgi:hypothetical protein